MCIIINVNFTNIGNFLDFNWIIGIRFNIFQLNQTYLGKNPKLNIGPKGFTGEKYGGSTYWDTEAYCLPFYMC